MVWNLAGMFIIHEETFVKISKRSDITGSNAIDISKVCLKANIQQNDVHCN